MDIPNRSAHGKSKRKSKKKTKEAAVNSSNASGSPNAGDGRNSGRRRPEIDPHYDRDNSLSAGGMVKENQAVLRTRLEGSKSKQRLNINCRVECVGRVMAQFSSLERKWINEMGMREFLNLCGLWLPRNLCYWVATRVDVVRKCLLTCDGKEFPISKVQVHWVLGLPLGEQNVPRDIVDEEMRREVDLILDSYSTQSPSGTSGISRTTLLSKVEADDVEELEFKRTFLMLVLIDVLCPTTCHRMSVSLLPAATVAVDAKHYDWCSFVLNHLFHALENFAKRFYQDGFAKGCGGCTIFLAILYLDRLNRPPVDWGVFPRLKVWTKKNIKKAELEDKSEGDGDYGKLGVRDLLDRCREASNGS